MPWVHCLDVGLSSNLCTHPKNLITFVRLWISDIVYEKKSVGQAIHVLTQTVHTCTCCLQCPERFHLGLFQILLSLCTSNVICTNLYLHQDSHNLVHTRLTHGLTETGSRLISKTLGLQKSSSPSQKRPWASKHHFPRPKNDPGHPQNTFPVQKNEHGHPKIILPAPKTTLGIQTPKSGWTDSGSHAHR